MTWFAAHELFTRLHHIRSQAEALLAGSCGPLALPALEAVGTIAAAARQLEAHLRDLQEIERLRRPPSPHRRARAVPLPELLPATLPCDPVHADRMVHLYEPARAAAALGRLFGAAASGSVAVRVGRRWLGLVLREGSQGAAAGEGEIARQLGLRQLAAAGARVRRRPAGILVLLPLVPPAGGVEAGAVSPRRARSRVRA